MESDNTRLYSILSYVGPLFLVGLLSNRENAKVMFHVNQGLVLFCASLALSVVSWILGVLPLGTLIPSLVSMVAWVGYVVLAIMGILNANNGVETELPLIGHIKLIK